MTELLPCPFCPTDLSDPQYVAFNKGVFDKDVHWKVRCMACGCECGLPEGTKEDAAEVWNTRPAITADDERQKVGTCHNTDSVPGDGSGFYPTPHFACSECGASYALTDYAYYCPGCGAKVVG